MKKYSLLILSFFLFDSSYSQDSPDTTHEDLKHGIQFQIVNFLEFTNFDGYTLSYRYGISKNSGLRIGLLTSIYESDNEIAEQVDSLTGNPENYGRSYSFKLSVQYLHKILSYRSFALHLGGGPFVGYGKTEAVSEDIGFSSFRSVRRNEKSFSYGMDLISAVEYSLTDNVIISGEYGITINKESSDIENTQDYIYTDGNPSRFSKEKGKIKRFNVSGMGVNLGIAVFF